MPPPGAVSNGSRCTFSSGTPAARRKASLPVSASDPRVMPWKPCVNATTSRRPVTRRASFRAASTALVPVGPMNCSFIVMPRGSSTVPTNASMKSRLVVVAMSRLCATPSASRKAIIARFMRGLLCPKFSTPAPAKKSM
jgi:hypothetical protein